MVVGAAGDFIVLLLGLEMSAVAVYALTAFARRRLTSVEEHSSISCWVPSPVPSSFMAWPGSTG